MPRQFETRNGAEMNESGGAIIFQPCEHADPERSVGLTEAEALGVEELQVACRVISEDQLFSSDIVRTREFGDGDFQLTSTPTHSQTISIESQSPESLATPPTQQLHSMSLPAVVVNQSCQGCKALEHQINSTGTAMETKISKLSELVTELNERLNQISKQKISSKSSFRQSDEVFTDKRLMRIKAAAFLTGRPLSAHTCKQLVLNI